jgi:hypothetical protein
LARRGVGEGEEDEFEELGDGEDGGGGVHGVYGRQARWMMRGGGCGEESITGVFFFGDEICYTVRFSSSSLEFRESSVHHHRCHLCWIVDHCHSLVLSTITYVPMPGTSTTRRVFTF